MTDYVVGSLSALFSKKPKNAVTLKSVKPLYEEYVTKPAKVDETEDVEVPERNPKTKRKLNSVDIDERQLKKKFKTRKEDSDGETEANDETDNAGASSNKEAALRRIERKNKKVSKENDGTSDAKRTFRYYEDDPAYTAQTVFIKNLPSRTQRKHLKKILANCGEILFIRFVNAVPAKSSIPAEAALKKRSLIKEGTTICAYVVFKEVDGVQSALKLNGVEFEGHHLRVDKREASNVPPKRSVFCGNLPFDTTDDELWKFFEDAGPIDYVRVVRNNDTGEGKGIAFVVFKDSSSALMALDFSAKEFKGRTIRVTAIEKKKPALATSKNAQIGGSKERINKKELEKKAQQVERKKTRPKVMNKQKKEKIKKNIRKEKAERVKKNFARKLQGKKKSK